MNLRLISSTFCLAALAFMVSCQMEGKSSTTPASVYDPEGGQLRDQGPNEIDQSIGNAGDQPSGNPTVDDPGYGDAPAPETPSAGYDCDTTDVFSEKMVCLHNRSRANAKDPVPSPALTEVSWNEDLAQIAANYAAKCIWDHNPNRSDNFNGYVGENIQVQSWAGNHAENSIRGWVDDEIPFYDYATNSCAPGEQCGHYTQVVWRTSVEIGCAVQHCPTMQGTSISPGYFTVCNYAPGGNFNGQKPY